MTKRQLIDALEADNSPDDCIVSVKLMDKYFPDTDEMYINKIIGTIQENDDGAKNVLVLEGEIYWEELI